MLVVEWRSYGCDQTATQIAEFLLHKSLTEANILLCWHSEQEPICNAMSVHA